MKKQGRVMRTPRIKFYCPAFFEEIAGTLHEIIGRDGIIDTHIGKVHLALPLSMEQRLKPLIGQTISILRTDIPEKEYLVLAIPKDIANNAMNELGGGTE